VLTTLRDEHAEVFKGLRYVIIEASPAMQCLQRHKLGEFNDQVEWAVLEEPARALLTAVAFSNELVDAMPVHVIRLASGRLEELYVTATVGGAKRLALAWGRVSTQEITEYLDRMNVVPREGQRLEVNLASVRWLGSLARLIGRGYLVTVDYGDTSAHLYGPDRAGGTLRSFYRHRLVDSPLERVGVQDITASVNFTALIEYGRDFGFDLVTYERQASFLIRMGLIERIAAMGEASSGDSSDLKHRLAVKNLFVQGGASDNFRVLIQFKR
jgi:SAM-dependent MidA family methyltransferase